MFDQPMVSLNARYRAAQDLIRPVRLPQRISRLG